MVAKRIIPCLDVKNGRVVKGTSFVNLRDAGDPVQAAIAYNNQGADELVLLDITASSDIMQISRMVNKELAEDAIKEYYLDLTYRTRHNTSEIMGIYKDDELVSFLSCSCPCYGKSVIDLVYTKDNFRGNGYSSAVIKGALNNEDTDYYLICELSLQGFYEKLGFELCGKCFKIVM